MTTPHPLVTIIIPCYNGARYVDRCLHCIEQQKYPALEILFVDDGSTDRSGELAARYPGVRLLRNDTPQGPSYNRNRGIAEARGKYIHFFDVDDRISSSFYERLVEAAERHDADVAFSGMINEAAPQYTQLFREERVYSEVEEKMRATYVGKWGYAWRYLIRTDLIRKHQISFPLGKYCEDLPFSFRAVYYARRIVTVPGAEYLYVSNEGSILRDPEKEARVRADREEMIADIRVFAREHHFRIPGLEVGVIPYVLRKLRYMLFPGQTRLTEEL